MSSGLLASSVGVVVVFGYRDPLSILNLMRMLGAQTHPPEAMVLVNFGDACPTLEKASAPFPYIYRHFPQGTQWSLAIAANQGVRLLPPVETVLFLDGDCLLAPDFLECGLKRLKRGVLLNCRILDLPQGAVTPETDVVRDFDRLKAMTKPRPEITAVGACQWVRMSAFQAIRGHDEGFKMWCFEDMDFQRRLRWLGLEPVHLDEVTSLLHQWHVSKDDLMKDPNAPNVKAMRYWYRTNLARLMNRAAYWDVGKFSTEEINPEWWGKFPKSEAASRR